MIPSTKRWLILLAGVVANLCQGVAYSSSVFMLPLGIALHRPRGIWASEWGFIFAMCLAFLPVGMIMSGKLADMGYTRLTIAIGALLYGGGLILAGIGNSVYWMALTLGVMTSVGSGFVYGTVIGAIVRWFPDRRGFASGVAVAAVGLGPIVLAPLIRWLIVSHGVMTMFVILGVVCLVAMGLAALCVVNPPAGYLPEGYHPVEFPGKDDAIAPTGKGQLNWTQMIRKPLFWLMYATYFCGVFSGVLVSGLAAPIAIELANFTPANATHAVMVFALASAFGRVAWGYLSDRLGRVFMIGLAFVLTAVCMFVLRKDVSSPGMFLPLMGLAGLCYGGIFGTFPSLSADVFGERHSAVNLAVLFTSFSLVALLAPQVIAAYRAGGVVEYPKAFIVAGCVAFAGLILSIIISMCIVKRRKPGSSSGDAPTDGAPEAANV